MKLEIGAIIKDLRRKQKYTQEQLAAYLGVTAQAISRWESGACYPDMESLPRLAAFFGVSADVLLGINKTERGTRLSEIYEEITIYKMHQPENHDFAIERARGYLSEFPSDENIQLHLADTLCLHMWEKAPDEKKLKEAERRYQSLIGGAQNPDRKNEAAVRLATLYLEGFKHPARAAQILQTLPKMMHSREWQTATVFFRHKEHTDKVQEYIEFSIAPLLELLPNYVIEHIPNTPENWDMKVEMMEKVIELYRFFFGENLLIYHFEIAEIYRFISTYRVAQKRYEETLTALERMCEHLVLYEKAELGDHFSSPFTDKLSYSARNAPINPPHNPAWMILHFRKLSHKRYDPVRKTERFQRVVKALENMAK
jgi:transcriptional regulator with XRE-family HTH domain